MPEISNRPVSYGPVFNPKMPFVRFLEGDGTETPGSTPGTPVTPPAASFAAPASQEDLDRIIGERLARERSKFADYSDLKAKAEQFDALEEKNKTELQKALDRAAAAEALAADASAKALRSAIAAAKNVPVDLLSGATKEELEAAADKLIAFRGEQTPGPKAPYVPAVTPGQGGQPPKSVAAGAEMFAESRKK
jgi:hypothetical protein